MEYKEIVAVTGEPGLFQLLSSKSDGAIVRSLNGETTKFVPSRNHNFTPLESIEVFTTAENVSLTDVFKAMVAQEETHPVIDAGKGTEDIKSYFREVFPTLDEQRVYMSDMKKMLKWYPQLKSNDLLRFEEDKEEEENEDAVGVSAQEGTADTAETAAKSTPAERVKKEKKVTKEKEEKKPEASAEGAAAGPEKKEVPKKEAKETPKKDTPKKKPAAKKASPAKKKD